MFVARGPTSVRDCFKNRGNNSTQVDEGVTNPNTLEEKMEIKTLTANVRHTGICLYDPVCKLLEQELGHGSGGVQKPLRGRRLKNNARVVPVHISEP